MKKLKNPQFRFFILLTLVLIISAISISYLINWQLTAFMKVNPEIKNLTTLKARVVKTLTIAFSLLTALVLALVLKANTYIKAKLLTLKEAIGELAQGDLRVKLPTKGEDIFTQVYTSFNQSVVEESNLITNILNNTEDLASYSKTLLASSEEGNAAIERTQELIENITAGIEEISATTQEVSGFAQESAAQTQVGKNNMHQTVEHMVAIADRVAKTVAKVEDLKENSNQIGNIVELINNIANQTNLLALNAAIEAARAGEHGQGFAVVAEEIRHLAEETAKATDNITNLIYNTQHNSQEVIEAIKEVEDKTLAGQKITQETNQIFNQIEETGEATAAQIEETAAATQDLAENCDNLIHASQDITSMSEEFIHSSDELANMSKQLQKILHEFILEEEQNNNWSSRYELGIAEIDQQHRTIFEKTNYLLELSAGEVKDNEVKEFLDFIANYVDQHFRDEEAIQKAYDYPDYERHQELHQSFEAKIAEFKRAYDNNSNKTSYLIKLNKVISNWLINHIRREDQRVAKHVKKVKEA